MYFPGMEGFFVGLQPVISFGQSASTAVNLLSMASAAFIKDGCICGGCSGKGK
jgi:hypothetical protein